MKEIVLNRKDYQSYKDMYKDIAVKTGDNLIEDYFDSTDYECDADILWECFVCDYGYAKNNIKIVLVNFDREKIAEQKNFDDYQYNIIFKVFERLVKMYPNNKLEFKMETKK